MRLEFAEMLGGTVQREIFDRMTCEILRSGGRRWHRTTPDFVRCPTRFECLGQVGVGGNLPCYRKYLKFRVPCISRRFSKTLFVCLEESWHCLKPTRMCDDF